jgi:hypothetical protein
MAKTGKPIKNVIRGDTRRVVCTFVEADNTTPINLSGGTLYFTVNTSSDPSDDSGAAIQKTATSFTDAANGSHTFVLSHSDTNIAPGDYWYDVQFVDSFGNYLSSYRGQFSVQSDTTRT